MQAEEEDRFRGQIIPHPEIPDRWICKYKECEHDDGRSWSNKRVGLRAVLGCLAVLTSLN